MLDKYISIYIPTCDSEGKKVNVDKRIDVLTRVEMAFIAMFEGFTETEAKGGWTRSGSGAGSKVIKERVTIIKSFYEVQSDHTVRKEVRRLAERVAKELDQECVSMEQNGTLYFVSPKGDE